MGIIMLLCSNVTCSYVKSIKGNFCPQCGAKTKKYGFIDAMRIIHDKNAFKKSPSGFLVCDKCNGYYKLQPGDKLENFDDTCECGGHLKFETNVEGVDDSKNQKKAETSNINQSSPSQDLRGAEDTQTNKIIGIGIIGLLCIGLIFILVFGGIFSSSVTNMTPEQIKQNAKPVTYEELNNNNANGTGLIGKPVKFKGEMRDKTGSTYEILEEVLTSDGLNVGGLFIYVNGNSSTPINYGDEVIVYGLFEGNQTYSYARSYIQMPTVNNATLIPTGYNFHQAFNNIP